ncbi:MAG TPA: hypothetical protein DCE71_06760 [Parachlamydiales bacterium]|nr:hypothetical protein [Parachlamydiales bacterium]
MSDATVCFPSSEEICNHLANHLKKQSLVDDYLSDMQAEANRITDQKIIQAVAQTFAHEKRCLGEIRLEIRLLINDLDEGLLLPAEIILQAGARLSQILCKIFGS